MAGDSTQLELVDPFKVCTIPNAPEDLGGGELTLVCLNSGGTLFDSCTGAAPLTDLPTPPSSMQVCSVDACCDANNNVVLDRVCRFSPAYDYPITCDFWSRTVGKQELSEIVDGQTEPEPSPSIQPDDSSMTALNDREVGLPERVTSRQELRAVIRMALQAVAPKHFWVHQRRMRGASSL
ncbi:hypothetical protein MMPV_002900 [Pyropia vietnamensis]